MDLAEQHRHDHHDGEDHHDTQRRHDDDDPPPAQPTPPRGTRRRRCWRGRPYRQVTHRARDLHSPNRRWLASNPATLARLTLRPREDAYAFAGVVDVVRADLATTSGYCRRRNREAQVEGGSVAAEGRPTPNAWLSACRRRERGRRTRATLRVMEPISLGRSRT